MTHLARANAGTVLRTVKASIGSWFSRVAVGTTIQEGKSACCTWHEETNTAILSLCQQGIAIKQIARRTGYSRGLIRKILRGQRAYLHAYIDGCVLAGDPKRPLFRTIGRGTDELTTTPLPRRMPTR
jgi:hypothetical protein